MTKKHLYWIWGIYIMFSFINFTAFAGELAECKSDEDEQRYAVEAAIFSANNQFILSGAEDTVKLWDIATGKKIREFNHGNLNRILRLAISPDNKYALSSGTRCSKNIMKLWNVKSGDKVKEFAASSISVVFSPDEKYILSTNFYKNSSRLCLWDIKSGKKIKSFIADDLNIFPKLWNSTIGIIGNRMFKIYCDWIRDISISPDGKYAACAVGSKVKVFNINTGNSITLKGHSKYVEKVLFSPNGKYILSGGQSKDDTNEFSKPKFISPLKLWDTVTGKLIRDFDFKKNNIDIIIYSMTFTPDGKNVIVDAGNFKISTFELNTGKMINEIKTTQRAAAFSPNGKYFLSTGDSLIVWDVLTGKKVKTLFSKN